mgnify:FL=1
MSEEVLEPTGETPTVVQALSAVMADVRAVAKKERNTSQGGGFYFRGIDAVVNAVGPALRTHGVVVTPHLDQIDRREGRTSKGGTLNYVAVIVTYTFTGPAGDTMTATVPGEAFDSGDKATAKAMSVAFRTCLLQALTLPTDEADPDADVYDATAYHNTPRHPAPAPEQQAHQGTQETFDPQAEATARWNDAAGLTALRDWVKQTNPDQVAYLTSLTNRIQTLTAPQNGAPA